MPTIENISSDTTTLFLTGIIAAVALIVALVILVSTMKVKSYKDKYVDVNDIKNEQASYIEDIEHKLHSLEVENASDKQELSQFAETKETLTRVNEKLSLLHNKFNEQSNELSSTKSNLSSTKESLEELRGEYLALKELNGKLNDDTRRLQSNNSSLLMKVEGMERAEKSQENMLKTQKQEIRTEFESLAKKVFDGNSQKFAEFSRENIDNMIKPLQTQIVEFKKQVADTYTNESKDRAVLKNEILSLKELNEKISQDAINLTNALKGESKQQGVWGEMVLENVLEASGLRKGKEFEREVSLRTSDNEVLRPDVVVHLPDNRDLIIDAKTSLVAYERYVNATDEDSKKNYLNAHLDSIKTHIKELSNKNYERLDEVNTLDFIFMFMPIEGALALALEHDSSIYDNAFKGKILLVGPTTLLVAMRAVENVWKYERQNQNAQNIAKRAGAMYDKFVGFSEDLMKISKQVDAIQTSFSAAKNKLSTGKGNLVRQVEQLKELGAQTSKNVPKSLKQDNNEGE